MLNELQHKAAQGARRAALGALGLGLVCVGTGFLTAAAWLVLSALRDAQFAALVIGLIYLGAGCIALFLGSRPGTPPQAETPSNDVPDISLDNLAVAFVRGFNSGKNMGR